MFYTNAKSHRKRDRTHGYTYVAQTERERDEGRKMPIIERAGERDEQRLMGNKRTHLNLNWELRDDGDIPYIIMTEQSNPHIVIF